MRNIRLLLQYEGTRYQGWQKQTSTDNTIQGKLEKLLSRMCNEEIELQGSGRTDAGVHALGQTANFHTNSDMPTEEMLAYINSYLPEDIAVIGAAEVPMDFNAIGSCLQKEYIYRIHNCRIRDPFLDRGACFYPQPLDIDRMARAAEAFQGTHDFAAVRSVGTETKTTVRTVHWCRAEKTGAMITVAVCADGFLYNMVRAIVGTLVYASYGKLEPEEIPRLLELGDRRLTGPTMPPQGLYMNRVWYDGPAGELMSAPESALMP